MNDASENKTIEPDEIQNRLNELTRENQDLSSQLNEIVNSKSYRILKKLRSSLLFRGVRKFRKLSRAASQKLWAFLPFNKANVSDTNTLAAKGTESISNGKISIQSWGLAESNQGNQSIVALYNPDWLGIRGSTGQLFDFSIPVNDEIDYLGAQQLALKLKELKCTRLVIQGFPITYKNIIQQVAKISPGTKIYVIWHGGFIQSDEDYGWNAFKEIEALCRKGLIWKLGFVKDGMAEVLAKTGLRTGFVMNYVRRIPDLASVPVQDKMALAIWSSARKPPYAMIAAAKLVEGASIHTWGNKPRIQEFAQLLQIKSNCEENNVDPARMLDVLARFSLNLYVSLYECAPMLPLESLSVGVPCLFGPHSHYFEDDPFLKSILVVPSPDRSDTIAKHIQMALLERTHIIDAYREYAPKYNKRAVACLNEFLDL